MANKMQIIYEPKGRAREYADLALNIYMGCTHGCLYCYGPTALHVTRKKFNESANPKSCVVERVKKDAELLSKRGDCPEILLSFIGDPYQPAETELGLTRQIIEILIWHDLPFTILTKGGTRAVRDFDLLREYPKCSFGTTMVLWTEHHTEKWEPGAADHDDRIEAIKTAGKMGIFTWVSLEPVIYPVHAIEIIRDLHEHVGHWKIGKINYLPEFEKRIDWAYWCDNELIPTLRFYDCDYYLKKSLTEAK